MVWLNKRKGLMRGREPPNWIWSWKFRKFWKVRRVKAGSYLNGFSEEQKMTSHSQKKFFFRSVAKISRHIGEVTTEIILWYGKYQDNLNTKWVYSSSELCNL